MNEEEHLGEVADLQHCPPGVEPPFGADVLLHVEVVEPPFGVSVEPLFEELLEPPFEALAKPLI